MILFPRSEQRSLRPASHEKEERESGSFFVSFFAGSIGLEFRDTFFLLASSVSFISMSFFITARMALAGWILEGSTDDDILTILDTTRYDTTIESSRVIRWIRMA